MMTSLKKFDTSLGLFQIYLIFILKKYFQKRLYEIKTLSVIENYNRELESGIYLSLKAANLGQLLLAIKRIFLNKLKI